ncbi:MAG TPA: nuclear transport factor 2 family protein [Dehalococcoidia bacterium]|nr:nuclear transport factor 2 family protein [Dehalococcoidia bacterium]
MADTASDSNEQVRDLAEQLAKLQARDAIVDVLQRYAMAVDGRDSELLRTCFSDDATANYMNLQECPTPEHLVDWVLGTVGRYDLTHHLNGVPDVQVDMAAGTAQSTTYLQAVHRRPEDRGGTSLILGGIYRDRHQLTNDGWRIAERRFETIWSYNTTRGQ